LPDFFNRTLTTGLRPYLVLSALCALLFLPGLTSIPPIDRDEARFMQATKQMLETGDLVHINFQDEPRNKKPVGIYWLQALAVKISGTKDLTSAWPYRLPSAFGAWLAVLALFRYGKELFNPKIGFMAATMLATSFIVVVEAHIAKTDAVLLATVTIAMLILAKFYTGKDKSLLPLPVALLFWAVLGIGFLVKGPLILMVVGATIAALCVMDRSAHWLKALHAEFGIPVALAVVLPWILAVSTGGGSNFFADALNQDLLPKLAGGEESHGALPGVHIAALFATAWPWSVLVPFAGVLAWRQRTNPAVRFCIAWLLPSWLIFELVPTKLPHYTMPLFPALTLLIAASLDNFSSLRQLLNRPMGFAYRAFWALACVALGGAIVWAAYTYSPNPFISVLALAITISAGVFGLVGLTHYTADRIVIGLGAAGLLFGVVLAGEIVPNLERLAVSKKLAEISAPHRDQDTVMAIAGYHEPSAVFLLGTDTRLTSWDGATGLLLSSEIDLMAIPVENVPHAAVEFEKWNVQMNELGEIKGRNYAKGEDVQMVLISASPHSAGEISSP
jgi:4-amino-4-deoxy-L-arabinose transferase-like glycosyltransferase